jgi:hypothetical protein
VEFNPVWPDCERKATGFVLARHLENASAAGWKACAR